MRHPLPGEGKESRERVKAMNSGEHRERSMDSLIHRIGMRASFKLEVSIFRENERCGHCGGLAALRVLKAGDVT